MLPKFLIEKTPTGESTLIEGKLPLRIAPPNGAGTYTVRAVSEQSTEVTISDESAADVGETLEGSVEESQRPEPRPAIPVNVAAAQLTGPAVIGTALTATAGSWEDATVVTGQWLRDGTPIEGATGPSYTPVAADDRTQLAYREIATDGATSLHQDSNALPVSYPAPTAKEQLHDEIFDIDSGAQIVETAGDFEGEALSFSVTGAGATIEPQTGRVAIPTDAALEGEVVTVTATNSGGSAQSALQVTVEDIDAPNQVVAFGTGGFEINDRASVLPGWTSMSNAVGHGFISYDYLPIGAPASGALMSVFRSANAGGQHLTLTPSGFFIRNSGGSVRTASAGTIPEARWSLSAGFVSHKRARHWLNDEPRAESGGGYFTGDMSDLDGDGSTDKEFNRIRIGRGGSEGYSSTYCAGRWAVSGTVEDMQALVEWIRAQPTGFADPENWPDLTASSVTIDMVIPLCQIADGTTDVEATDPALGGYPWTLIGTNPTWRDSRVPRYADDLPEPQAGPTTTDTLDIKGGSAVGGYTVRFSEPVLVGQFVSGEWWAVADGAQITAFEPESYQDTDPPANGTVANRVRNGLSRDLPSNAFPFDSNINLPYKSAENIDPGNTGQPLVVAHGDILVKGKSKLDDSSDSPLSEQITLTILNAQPPVTAFRPPIKVWDGVTFWEEANIDWTRLPSIADTTFRNPGNGSIKQPYPSWYSAGISQQMKNVSPSSQWPGYYQFDGQIVGKAMLFACSDAPLGTPFGDQKSERKAAAIQLIQMGIDATMVDTEVPGGHYNHGLTHAFGFAAHMLDDPAFDALLDLSEAWPSDKAAVDQLQRRYNWVEQHHIDNDDPSAKGSGGRPYHITSQGAHLGFPEWAPAVKTNNDVLPTNGEVYTFERPNVYREIGFDAWVRAGLCFYVMRETPTQSYDPATNPNVWDRIGLLPARDYFDRLMGWNEQLALGYTDKNDSYVWISGDYPGMDAYWPAYQTYVLGEGYAPASNWGQNNDVPAKPEWPMPPRVAYDSGTRTLTVTPDAFRALNHGFPHDDANLTGIEMRCKIVSDGGLAITWENLHARLDTASWTVEQVAAITDRPTLTVPSGGHFYAVQFRHQTSNGWSPWSYNSPLHQGAESNPANWRACGHVG